MTATACTKDPQWSQGIAVTHLYLRTHMVGNKEKTTTFTSWRCGAHSLDSGNAIDAAAIDPPPQAAGCC